MYFRTNLTITWLECWNAGSTLWFHVKCELRLTRPRKETITEPSMYAQTTWLTSSNHDLVSVNVLRIGNFDIASTQQGSLKWALSGGHRKSLSPGRTGMCPCWERLLFCTIEQGTDGVIEGSDIGAVEQAIVYDLHFAGMSFIISSYIQV